MNKKYLLLGLLIIIFSVLVFKQCDNRKIKEVTDEHLRPQEKTAIIIDTDTGQVTTITRRSFNGTNLSSQSPQIPPEIVKRTDGARDIRISIDNRGNVSYAFRTWGFEFAPGAGTCYASGHAGITLNDGFFFYRKHEALVGLRFALSGNKEIRPYVAYAYGPRWKYLTNTSLVIGTDLDKSFVLGVNTKF